MNDDDEDALFTKRKSVKIELLGADYELKQPLPKQSFSQCVFRFL